MLKKKKPVRIHVTMNVDLALKMKACLEKLNEDKSLKYISKSEFINEAVNQLLVKESLE